MSERKYRLRTMCLASAVLACAVGCATSTSSRVMTTSAATQATGLAAGVPNLYDAQRLVDEYIRGGRYDADVAKVVADARAWLEERTRTAKKPAIVLSLGDQQSDLTGGYAERTFKLPNPVYYLP
jgi:HAD superfamily, subfamily IIIB (Acid phosphatase)